MDECFYPELNICDPVDGNCEKVFGSNYTCQCGAGFTGDGINCKGITSLSVVIILIS